MSDHQTPAPSGAGELRDTAKRSWHTPKLEEVDYTEAEGVPVGNAPKRAWHTPRLEEVDYAAAESGIYSAPTSDLTTYSS